MITRTEVTGSLSNAAPRDSGDINGDGVLDLVWVARSRQECAGPEVFFSLGGPGGFGPIQTRSLEPPADAALCQMWSEDCGPIMFSSPGRGPSTPDLKASTHSRLI